MHRFLIYPLFAPLFMAGLCVYVIHKCYTYICMLLMHIQYKYINWNEVPATFVHISEILIFIYRLCSCGCNIRVQRQQCDMLNSIPSMINVNVYINTEHTFQRIVYEQVYFIQYADNSEPVHIYGFLIPPETATIA